MLRNDRLYKSLSLDDFIENISFIAAKGGLLLTGHTASFNYEKTLPRLQYKSNEELKKVYINGVKHIVNDILGLEIRIDDMETYYDVWLTIKE